VEQNCEEVPNKHYFRTYTPLAFELNAWWELQKIVILMTAASVRPLHALALTTLGNKGLNDTRDKDYH
jgi:hypothetical protein